MNENRNTFNLFQAVNAVVDGLKRIGAELTGGGSGVTSPFNAGEAFGSLQRLAHEAEHHLAAKPKHAGQSCEVDYFLAYSG